MRLKPGVRLIGVRPEIVVALVAADGLWREVGIDGGVTITAGMDGTHKVGSFHYAGCAFDARTRGLTDAKTTVAELAARLGPDYDVLLEGAGTDNEHCHVEWEPKTPY